MAQKIKICDRCQTVYADSDEATAYMLRKTHGRCLVCKDPVRTFTAVTLTTE